LNRVDAVQMTVGLHVEVARTVDVRIGGVFPFYDEPHRPFDSEIQVAVNRRF